MNNNDRPDTGVVFNMPTPAPAGEYTVRLQSVVERTFQFGPSYIFTFEIVDGPEAGKTVQGLAPKKLTPGNKLYNWVTSLGGAPRVGESFMPSALVGSMAHAHIEIKADKNNPTILRNQVKALSLVSRAMPSVQTVATLPQSQPTQAPVYQQAPMPNTVQQMPQWAQQQAPSVMPTPSSSGTMTPSAQPTTTEVQPQPVRKNINF